MNKYDRALKIKKRQKNGLPKDYKKLAASLKKGK